MSGYRNATKCMCTFKKASFTLSSVMSPLRHNCSTSSSLVLPWLLHAISSTPLPCLPVLMGARFSGVGIEVRMRRKRPLSEATVVKLIADEPHLLLIAELLNEMDRVCRVCLLDLHLLVLVIVDR